MRTEAYQGDAAAWDAFVRSCAGWTNFHLYSWRRLVEQVFGHETEYLCARTASGELVGVLPLVRMRSRVFGHFLVSQPFVNYGGPLGSSEAVRALARHAVELTQRTRADLLELRTRAAVLDELPVSERRKVIAVVDLVPDANGKPLWDRLDAKVRSQVRRPAKAGVTYSVGVDQIEPFYQVYAAHMRDLGTPALSRRFFHALYEAFSDDVWFGCAWLNGEPIAAGCAVRWGDEIEMTWASALLRHKGTSANMGLYWHFMQAATEGGVRTFNFGRCTPGSGTHRFKQQWGTRDEPLAWYSYRCRGAATTPAPTDARWAWGPRLWKRLPVRVATVLGPAIIRSIP